MATLRTHINMPVELARGIDEFVGRRKRSAFMVEAAANELKRQKLLAFLESEEPVWKDEDHPEIAKIGAAAWVHKLRHTRSGRQARLEKIAAEADE